MKFRVVLLFVVILCVGVAAAITYRSWAYRCLSHRPGFRGEVMRAENGRLLYFNGDCSTMQQMPASDWPL